MNYKSNSLYFMVLSALSITLSFFSAPYVYSAENELKIGGVGSALGAMKVLGAVFEQSHPGIKVKIFPSLGSTGGVKAVAEGSVDIGLSGRALKDEELKTGLSVIEYARTPMVFVVNKSVKISGLTTGEIVEIYKGKKQKWPDGQRIRLILRPASDSDTLVIRKISPEMNEALEAASLRAGMLTAPTDQENVDLIERTPGAAGFSTLTQITSEMRHVKILAYNNVEPSVKALAKGIYPLSKALYIVTKQKPSALARGFLDFIQSEKGVEILEALDNLAVTGNKMDK
ncbi:MAG: substrate-binding domain-containing protein [Nitrospirae bacterium]|nr:substrate-binding domain-containing protein [Nitrospirota bacterium]